MFFSPRLPSVRRNGLVAMSVLLAGTTLGSTAAAQTARQAQGETASSVEDVVVTAARTILPASALPMTVEVIDRKSLAEQVAISGSVIDAVATLSAFRHQRHSAVDADPRRFA